MHTLLELFSLITFHIKHSELNLIFLFMYPIISIIFVDLI